MTKSVCYIPLFFLVYLSGQLILARLTEEVVGASPPGGQEYVNEWAVRIPGGETEARRVSHELGFQYGGRVSNTQFQVVVFFPLV